MSIFYSGREKFCQSEQYSYNEVMMMDNIRWTAYDKQGHLIYLTQERWEHIIDPINHPEMNDFEQHLQLTIRTGKRQQDSLNPKKYRYSQVFNDLAPDNTHVVAIVLFGHVLGLDNRPRPNNYVVTAYQKEIG